MKKNDFVRYFELAVLAEKDKTSKKSRQKLIVMPIEQFLLMALPLTHPEPYKEAKLRSLSLSLTNNQAKLNELPILLIGTRLDGDHHLATVFGHEGRHRAMLLESLGCRYMPVILNSNVIRWSEQQNPDSYDYLTHWPSTLRSEDLKHDIAFPLLREQADIGQFHAFHRQSQSTENSCSYSLIN